MSSTKYKHIFFDLDDTLWDFFANSNEALNHLFAKYKLDEHSVTAENLRQSFHDINNELWVLYQNNKIDKDYLRNNRFQLVFEKLKNESFSDHVSFGKEYLAICPTKKNLVDGTEELLNYLQGKYNLHVITNGFDEIADIKLECSGLRKYFREIITSEKAGTKKPDPGIFEYAIKKMGALPSESIMIGNDLEADIYGAMRAGIDQVFYNPQKLPAEPRPTFEVHRLDELHKIL